MIFQTFIFGFSLLLFKPKIKRKLSPRQLRTSPGLRQLWYLSASQPPVGKLPKIAKNHFGSGNIWKNGSLKKGISFCLANLRFSMLKLLILSGLASTQKSEFLRLASQSAKVYLQNNYFRTWRKRSFWVIPSWTRIERIGCSTTNSRTIIQDIGWEKILRKKSSHPKNKGGAWWPSKIHKSLEAPPLWNIKKKQEIPNPPPQKKKNTWKILMPPLDLRLFHPKTLLVFCPWPSLESSLAWSYPQFSCKSQWYSCENTQVFKVVE